MIKLSIIYAPDTPENRKAAEEVAAAVDVSKCAMALKKASESSLSDLSGADIVLFGIQKADAADIPEDLREYARIFKGINFAGKTAAFFGAGPEKASSALRKSLKATDISLMEAELTVSDKNQTRQAEIKEWMRQVMAFHQAARNAGK